MDKTLTGVLATIGALVPLAGAQAAVTQADVEKAMHAESFAELLKPVPNAAAILKLADADRAANGAENAAAKPKGVQLAWHHHHHHHHHNWAWHHHHHHFWWHNHWYHHHHHHHFW